MLAADFLEANFDKVFSNYQKLLHSDNYVTRRQSLKLLGELLLDRHNFSVSSVGIYFHANQIKSYQLSVVSLMPFCQVMGFHGGVNELRKTSFYSLVLFIKL